MSNKFVRSGGNIHRGGEEARPAHVPGRVYGQQVAVGEPFQIQGDAEMRKEIQASLEFLATQHLLEAEAKANQIIAKARSEASGILEKANAQGKEMLAQVQTQVDGIREAAHEEGFKAGFQEGYADATEHVEQETVDLLKGVQTLVEGAYDAEKRVLKEFEVRAARMVRHVVHQVLNRELDQTPEAVVAMIDHAIESLYLSGKVQVVVSAQAVQDLREYSVRIRDGLDAMSRFELIADPNLDLHQIYIIGQEGCFDLSPHNQAQQLLKPLEGHLDLPKQVDSPPSVLPLSGASTGELNRESPPPESRVSEVMDLMASDEALSEQALETLNAMAAEALATEAASPALQESKAPQLSELPAVEAAPYVFPAFDEVVVPPEESEPETP